MNIATKIVMASTVALLTSSVAFCAAEISNNNPSGEKFIKIYPENLEW
jgi:Spy/CpxP family protein refolding chaperone